MTFLTLTSSGAYNQQLFKCICSVRNPVTRYGRSNA